MKPDWPKVVTLPDGRVCEYVWATYIEEAIDVGPGHRRFEVAVLLDGEVAVLPIVLPPDVIEEAVRDGQ